MVQRSAKRTPKGHAWDDKTFKLFAPMPSASETCQFYFVKMNYDKFHILISLYMCTLGSTFHFVYHRIDTKTFHYAYCKIWHNKFSLKTFFSGQQCYFECYISFTLMYYRGFFLVIVRWHRLENNRFPYSPSNC